MEEVFPGVRAQQCWVHKTANVLDKLPKRVRPDAKSLLHEMYMAHTRPQAEDACDRFRKLYGARYPKAAECLEKDRDVLFTFYDFPAAQWVHLRTHFAARRFRPAPAGDRARRGQRSGAASASSGPTHSSSSPSSPPPAVAGASTPAPRRR